ncbi:glutathione transferase [Tatumella citrea]|uniref:Glutathione S-transferase n=1 Tax=Tatumella citrea TaxID=53336 RepID=A0A1Y0LAK9_TATCI|nr:glutathione transferase [Tatumella citrea]ARU94720.1 glutathione S-transferase [Tatumella citrea]ARU98758.1 glutathione S-transferase [Tatumella citrea]
MSSPELILWCDSAFHSPYAMSVYVCLQEKGLRFSVNPLNLAQHQHTSPELSSLLLTGRIPCLQHDGFAVSESSAIGEYLDETFPAPDYPRVYPADRQQKAVARQVQAWLRSDFLALRTERPTDVIFSGRKYPPLSAAGEQDVKKLISGALQLLGQRTSLFGQWSVADCDLAVMLNRLALHGDPLPEKLREYAAFQWQRAAIQLWVNEAQKLNNK